MFDKTVPFVTEETEKTDGKFNKGLRHAFAKLFDNDQRNLLVFAVIFGTLGIWISFLGLFIIAKGHPFLMAINFVLLAFVICVGYMIRNMYLRANDRKTKNYVGSKR